MLLGIDVGGTHTDAVLIDKNSVIASFKAVTNHENLLLSIKKALEEVTRDIDRKKITNINLSTTLSTNAIIENKIEKVGLMVSSGPGIDPETFALGDSYYILTGSIDHRGSVVRDFDQREVDAALQECKKQKVQVYAMVTKFSTRNPDKENLLAEKAQKQADFISLGHRMSSMLNFPRRIATAYYNSAVWRTYNRFVDAIEESTRDIGFTCPLNVLKADGGTIPLKFSRSMPVQTILSGPSASIMGIIALCDITEDSVILDIGGTTTDIAIFASGTPLLEREGASFNSHPTLVRALKSVSIGIGGDSCIKVKDGSVSAGPERKGPSLAEGGKVPALIDVLNYNNSTGYGDVEASQKGIEKLAEENKVDPGVLVKQAIEFAVNSIINKVNEMVRDINEKPVYTIHEMLEGVTIDPRKVYIMGGPAQRFAPYLSVGFNKEVVIPDNYAVANAIGSALARPTFEIELFADTNRGVCLVPNLDIKKMVERNFSLNEAEEDARDYLYTYLNRMGFTTKKEDIDIIESTSFKMVQGFFSSGRDIRVKCQVRPDVVMRLKQ